VKQLKTREGYKMTEIEKYQAMKEQLKTLKKYL
jgi:hypothetical protein